MKKAVRDILKENARRCGVLHAPFNPITGEGSTGERVKFELSDFSLPVQYIPKTMLRIQLVKKLQKAGSIEAFIENELGLECNEETRSKVVEMFVRKRIKHDFCFWGAMEAYIKNKGGGDDVLFHPNYPQRIIIEHFEKKRLAGMPIRLIILKARQLGGSTLIQMYFAWLQLVHKQGLNSLIISLQAKASDEIYDMYNRLIKAYPVHLLHEMGEAYNDNEAKFVGVGVSGAIHLVPQRNCKIKLGSAEKPDSCRGGDYNLVHLSEVGLWKKTDGKSPEDIVQGSCSGIPLKPYTMIVYESTARGTGNFFHREYEAAKAGKSQFDALFIPWFIVPLWSMEFNSKKEREVFATWLYENRLNANGDERSEPGKYLWWAWKQGASLEAMHWYVNERSGRSSHSSMSSEYPSDDVEAFTDIDNAEFDRYLVEKLKPSCRAPKFIGDVYADGDEGEDALVNLRFKEDAKGLLWVWALPEIDPDEDVLDRYLVVVDIGGHSNKADWSVIVVFDRLMMMDGGKPSVVAQWYGHIDMDILAWKSAQIASFYDNALLVIESNTLETHDRERYVDGNQANFILNLIKDVYPNLYARSGTSEDAINEGKVVRYGFHTNVATKPVIISTLKKCVREQLYVERDERCLHQYLVYERKPNGSLGAVAGDHDDILMTRAIGLHICFREMPLPEIVKREQEQKTIIHTPIVYRKQ